jgi:riboflavin kinase, archaea type
MSILKRCLLSEKESQSKMIDAFKNEQVEFIFMRGKILSGLGQAQYFLTREGYSRQFTEKLGFVPFPGTLNVLLEEPFQTEWQEIQIEGFSEEGRSFGECRCCRIKLNGMQAVVVRPERSRYPPELIEVIAPVKLRALGLDDGDTVEIVVNSISQELKCINQ